MIRPLITSLLIFGVVAAGCGPVVTRQDRASSHHKMAKSYLAGNDYSRALQELLQAEKQCPEDAEIHAALGEVYFQKKAYELAEKHYKRALQIDPDNPTVENNLAALYLDMRRWDEAARLFRKVADNLLFPYTVRALSGLGIAYHYAGEHLKAVLVYNEALEVAPNDRMLLFLQAKTYRAMDKPDLARQRLEEVVRLYPDFNAARLLLGETYLQLDQRSAAINAFREVANREDQTVRGKKARDYLQLLEDGA